MDTPTLTHEARIDPRVPYDRLDQAVADARVVFPNATRIRPLWTPSGEHEIHVEVYGLDPNDLRRGRVFVAEVRNA